MLLAARRTAAGHRNTAIGFLIVATVPLAGLVACLAALAARPDFAILLYPAAALLGLLGSIFLPLGIVAWLRRARVMRVAYRGRDAQGQVLGVRIGMNPGVRDSRALEEFMRDPQRVLFYELALRLVLDGRELGEARIPIRVRNGDAQHRIVVGSWIPARVDPAMPQHAIADLSSLGVELH